MFIPREFCVNLPVHDELPAEERPVFRFRASTWAERQEILAAGEDWENARDEREIIIRILPLLKRHLLRAPFPGELEQELDYVGIVELYSRMRLADQLSGLAKKNSVLPSPSEPANSTPEKG